MCVYTRNKCKFKVPKKINEDKTKAQIFRTFIL